MTRPLVAAAVLLALVGIAASRADQPLVTYALVARDDLRDTTVLLARAILDGADTACPDFMVDGAAVASRARPNPDPVRFPVTVCEAAVPLGAAVSVAGEPVATLAGRQGDLRVAVIGDTGCRPDKQDCDATWPFPHIAAAAAADGPDLVVHVGDWDYRGTPSRRAEGEPRVYDGCLPDDDTGYVSLADLSTWQTWNDDVFTPAAPLLAAAPWVAVRGNHELCSRAGDGWFYLLDPHSALLDPLHGEPTCTAPVVDVAPYAVSVGGLDLVVLDTSDGCDNAAWQTPEAMAYQARLLADDLAVAGGLAARSGGPVWLVSHRAFWSANETSSGVAFDGSDALQAAVAALPGSALPSDVALVLSGHVHEGQALTFDGPRPPQLIAGNGGVALEDNVVALPVDLWLDGLAATGWVSTPATTPNGFGYLDLVVRDAADWDGAFVGFAPDGARDTVPLMTCAMPVRDGDLCAPPAP